MDLTPLTPSLEVDQKLELNSRAWPWGIPTKILPPLPTTNDLLSIPPHPPTASLPGATTKTWKPAHDDAVTQVFEEWIGGPLQDHRVEAWNAWTELYFPLLCEASQNRTLKSFARSAGSIGGGQHHHIMGRALQCLDTVFFGGSVTPYCTFEWAGLEWLNARAITDQVGPARIRISADFDTITNIMELIASLLHELCHAFLFLYGCRQGTRCQQCPGNEKAGGHDDCFLRVSKMVQELACSLHGPENLDLVRVRSFLLEHSRNEAMPTLEAIQGHFTDIKEHNEATLSRLKWLIHAGIPLEAGDITSTPRPYSSPEVVNTKLKYCTDSDLLKAKMSIVR